MDSILLRWREWRGGKDDGFVYDCIDDFFAGLSRGDLLAVIEFIADNYDPEAHGYKIQN